MALLTIKIERTVREPDAPTRRGRRAVVAVLGATALVVAGSAFSLNEASAAVTPITPRVIFNGALMGSHGVLAPIASGGSTTVPTNATRVQFSITVTKHVAATGSIDVYPYRDLSRIAPDGSVAWETSGPIDGTVLTRVGVSNKVAFVNNSSGSVTVTVKLIGYTTDVRASDIDSTGGHPGDVLTDTGSGAAWQSAHKVYVAHVGTDHDTGIDTTLTLSGDAISAVNSSQGKYNVTFAHSVEDCVATASIGFALTGGVASNRGVPVVFTDNGPTVDVWIAEPNVSNALTTPTNSSFHLIVVC